MDNNSKTVTVDYDLFQKMEKVYNDATMVKVRYSTSIFGEIFIVQTKDEFIKNALAKKEKEANTLFSKLEKIKSKWWFKLFGRGL